MGWGRTLLLGDIGNRMDIADVEQDIERLCRHVRVQPRIDNDQDTRMEMLEAENCELKLYLAAVIRLLMSKGAVSRVEFARFVDIIDRSDGSEDGQFRGDIAQQGTWTGDGDRPPDDAPDD